MKIQKHTRAVWFAYGFESIAVIVGIVVALALENWNDARKQNNTEINYLSGLIKDLANDTAYFNRLISDSEKVTRDNSEFLNYK